MEIVLDLISESISKHPKPLALPADVIDGLEKRYSHMQDIRARLYKLPVIPKGKQVAKYPATDTTKYATTVHKAAGQDVYIGYYVFKDSKGRWDLMQHSFNVHKGRVHEWCDVDWKPKSYYVGMRVPEKDLSKNRYIAEFSRLAYIMEHSERALFDVPTKEE